MGVQFFPVAPTTPNTVLAKLKKAIDDKKATTWTYSGDEFHYEAEQWKAALKFEASIKTGSLHFAAQPGKGNPNMTYNDAFNYVHGRFVEFLMNHGGAFTEIKVTDTRKKS